MIKQVLGPMVGTIRGEEKGRGGRLYREEYWVEFGPNSTHTPVDDILADDRVPHRGRPYVHNNAAICTAAPVEQLRNHKWIYRVKVVYSTSPGTTREEPPSGAPWEWPVVSATEWSERNEFRGKDLDGKAFQNTAGTPLIPPPPIRHWEPTLVLSYATRSFAIQAMGNYAGAINLGDWFNCPSYSWRCVPRGTVEANHDGERYLKVAIAFERFYDAEQQKGLWHPHREPNVGFYAYSPTTGDRAHITDDYGNPVVEPQNLDPDGMQSADQYELEFHTLRAVSFAEFDILLAAASLM